MSSDDALGLLKSWNQDSSKLRCTFTASSGLSLCLTGTLDRVSPGEAFGFRSTDKESWLIVNFKDVLLFLPVCDETTAPDENRDVAAQYKRFLPVQLRDGGALLVGELKEYRDVN